MPTLAEKVAAVTAARESLERAVAALEVQDPADPTDMALGEDQAVALLGPNLVYANYSGRLLTFRLAYATGDPADLAALAALKAKLDQAT